MKGINEMVCPDCKSPKIRRIERKGISKLFWSLLGWWPYFCDTCSSGFDLRLRHLPRR